MKKAVLLVLGASALAFGGEMFARYILGLGDPPLSVADPAIEYMFAPNQDVLRFGKRFFVNSHAMRSQEFPAERRADEIRIMMFGDSVLNGGSLTDQSDLATTLLARELNSNAASKRIIVGNISAGSWGPGNWLSYAQTFGFFYADVVVLVISSHDVTDNPTFAPLDPSTHPTEKPVFALVEGATRYLPRYLGAILKPAEPKSEVFGESASVEIKQQEKVRGLADLRAFLLLAGENGRHVFIVQWPERSEMDAGVADGNFADVTALANELGLACIVLAPFVANAIKDGREPYRDNIHPNEHGQKVLADVLLGEISAVIEAREFAIYRQ